LNKTGASKIAANGKTGTAKEHLGASPLVALMAPLALEFTSLTSTSSLVSILSNKLSGYCFCRKINFGLSELGLYFAVVLKVYQKYIALKSLSWQK
jgi:hypothetical protein